ncbi:MAG TPA: hypothetical protein PK644_10020, partial [bacterium]|nr:hypothetical protein [bacterium]
MKPSKTDFFLAGGWTKLVVTLTEKNPAAPEVCIAAVSLEETRTPVRKERKRTGRVCPACGYRWQDIRRYRFLGCPDCYQHFSPFLSQEKARGQFWW